MINIIRSIVFFLCVILMIQGCTQQRDLYVKAPSMLVLVTDWQNASVEPDIWTAMFYNGNKYSLTLNNKYDSITIQQGNYEALAVNGTLSSGIDYVRFRGTDNFDSFEAYATPKTLQLMFDDYAGSAVINSPDTLYGASVYKEILGDEGYYIKYRDGRGGFFVPNKHFGDTITFVPQRLTYKVNVVATLYAFENAAKSTYVVANLNGFASSVHLATGMPSHQSAFQEFSFPRPQVRTSSYITTASYNSFGPPVNLPVGSRNYFVRLKFMLRNGARYDKQFDVSNQVETIISKIKQEHIKEFTLYITDTLPNVVESGTIIGVAPWEDDIRFPIPL